MEDVYRIVVSGESFGVEEDSEKTYVELYTRDEIMSGRIEIDWATLGMIVKALEHSE